MYLRWLSVLGLISLTISCQMKQDKGSILAKAYGNQLYVKDLTSDLKDVTTKADSTAVIDKKVDEWLMQEILYKEAKTRLKEDPILEQMAEAYKKELYIHKMESALKSEQAQAKWSPQEKQKFIASEGISATLEEELIQFLLVKAPKEKDSEKLQSLWKTEDLPGLRAHIGELEAYAQLDVERWYKKSQLTDLLPDELVEKINFDSEKSYTMDHNDDLIFYKTINHLSKGDSIPSKLLDEIVNTRLSRVKFKEFINSWKTELYQNKIQSKDIEISSLQG